MIEPGALQNNGIRRASLHRATLTGGRFAAPPLTDRQAELLAKLREYRAVTGEAMPQRVLARTFAMTVEGVRHHLVAIARKGYGFDAGNLFDAGPRDSRQSV